MISKRCLGSVREKNFNFIISFIAKVCKCNHIFFFAVFGRNGNPKVAKSELPETHTNQIKDMQYMYSHIKDKLKKSLGVEEREKEKQWAIGTRRNTFSLTSEYFSNNSSYSGYTHLPPYKCAHMLNG